MKAVWLLIAITQGGEYIERRNLTIHQCVGYMSKSRQAAAWVAEKHPSVVVTYECRQA